MKSKMDLALEIAANNNRCGAYRTDAEGSFICLRAVDHKGEHSWESVNRVIPFDEWRPSDAW